MQTEVESPLNFSIISRGNDRRPLPGEIIEPIHIRQDKIILPNCIETSTLTVLSAFLNNAMFLLNAMFIFYSH